ncbi:hypothetical protein [Pseudaminobacter sp. NGMCC 1.201702]|uniref:hypothetical protein n=1 Tax=Pseudaminobacter sp. NGMCC 1.201702 TaxID=3391825 RepID=UPI0039F06E08
MPMLADYYFSEALAQATSPVMSKMIDIRNVPRLRVFHDADERAFLFRPMAEERSRFLPDGCRAPMRMVSDAASVPDELKGSVMLLGNFDGFHRGHQQLLAEAKVQARHNSRPIGAMSVEPHPRQLFTPQSPAFRLSTPAGKKRLFSRHGLDFLYSPRFNHRFAAQEPEQFVDEILVGGFNVGHLVVGSGFRFGRQRRGDVKMLREIGDRRGFGVSAVDEVRWGDVTCSSTAVRNLLTAGDIDAANAMLGYRWSVELNQAVNGGANVEWPSDVLLLACGDYDVSFKGASRSEPSRRGTISIRPAGQVRLNSEASEVAATPDSLLVEFRARVRD